MMYLWFLPAAIAFAMALTLLFWPSTYKAVPFNVRAHLLSTDLRSYKPTRDKD